MNLESATKREKEKLETYLEIITQAVEEYGERNGMSDKKVIEILEVSNWLFDGKIEYLVTRPQEYFEMKAYK